MYQTHLCIVLGNNIAGSGITINFIPENMNMIL